MAKKFRVEITETLQREVEVEATSHVDAIVKVQEMWNDDEIILDSEDFVGMELKMIKDENGNG